MSVRSSLLLLVMLGACADDGTLVRPDNTPPPEQPRVDASVSLPDAVVAPPDASNPDQPMRADAAIQAQDDDCDPDGPIHPGAKEILDGLDNDCDGETDEMVVCKNQLDAFWTITEALAAADTGNLIEVCPGTYPERLVISRPVRLIGAGLDVTTIDATGGGPAVVVEAVSAPGVTIKGFTITNGVNGVEGGGVRCSVSVLRLEANLVTGNRAVGGGGLFTSGCAIEAIGNRLEANEAGTGIGGGGALLVASTGQLAGGVVADNHGHDGGGIFASEGMVAIRGNQILRNTADVKGAGMWHASDAPIEDNLVDGNVAGWKAGGIYVPGHAPLIRANTISNNLCIMNDGGGLFVDVSSAHIVENLVTGNESGDDAGGIRCLTSTATLERNRIIANRAPHGAGGGAKISHMPSLLVDNIITDNVSGGHGGGLELDNDASVIRGGVIQNNTAVFGGGIHLALAPWRGQLLEGIQILDNHASVGGGIHLDDNFQQITLRGLTISGNSAGRGGAIQTERSNVNITNCLMVGNSARREGGAIHAGNLGSPPAGCPCEAFPPPTPPDLCICPPEHPAERFDFIVAVGNRAPTAGSVWVNSPDLSIENSIFFQNVGEPQVVAAPGPTPPPTPEDPNPLPPLPIPPVWRFNDTLPATFGGMLDPTGSDGNISVDPGFMPNDYHLQSGSMCVNAGDPALVDMDGTRADMGRFGGMTP